MNLLFMFAAVTLLAELVITQQLPFEIPVQLIGFPLIIMAVRISNFLKKLSYALNPSTYRSRVRRETSQLLIGEQKVPVLEVEKQLISEMGDNVCIYLDACLHHADRHQIDWNSIYSDYLRKERKEFYLLSVFLGDILRSPEMCRQLVKRGRGCPNETPEHKPLIGTRRPKHSRGHVRFYKSVETSSQRPRSLS